MEAKLSKNSVRQKFKTSQNFVRPPEDQFADAFRSGVIATSLGMLGMCTKLLFSDKKLGWGKSIRHTIAAGLTAFFVGQSLEDVQISNGLKMALLGITGASSTEIVDYSIRWVKSRAKKMVVSRSKMPVKNRTKPRAKTRV